MSVRKLSSHALSAAFALAAFAAFVPAQAAPLLVTTGKYSLTFQDGWQSFPVGTGDSVKVVMQPTLEATCYMTASVQDHPLSAQEIAAYMALYGGADSVTQTASGTATLGGKSFNYVDFKSNDSADADTRVRFYYTVSGSLLFNAFVGYDVTKGTAPVTQVEAALATLTLNGGAALRPVAEWRRPAFRPAVHDALGRFRPAAYRTPLFRLPAL
jgi:hypothetical protein